MAPNDASPAIPIKAVIFDSDGTLVDSEPISLKVLVELIAERGLQIPHDKAVAKWSDCDLADVFREIEERLGSKLPDNFLDTFREHQLERLSAEVKPISGAKELLASLTLPFCVASNAPQNKVRLCLETTELLPLVKSDCIFSAYDINAWKPRPDLFLHAAKQLGFEPAECAVVEDSGVGVEAGIAAGMQVYAYDPHSELGAIDGAVTIRELSELTPVFQQA